MNTRSGSPAPPLTPCDAAASGRASPAVAQVETELRREVEHRCSTLRRNADVWKRRFYVIQRQLRIANDALKKKQDAVHFMDRKSSQFRKEVPVLRKLLQRWDQRNWAELCVSALKGSEGGSQIDYTMDVRDCVAFMEALKEIHRRRDESCRTWLEDNAFRPEKMMLVKMAHRVSGRRCQWQNQLMKFDFSARDKAGERVRKREMMAEDSIVRSPEIFPTKKMRRITEGHLTGPDGLSVHVQTDDHSGAMVRDVAAACLKAFDSAKGSSSGGMATAGTQGNPHWMILSMDGAGLTNSGKSGVRIVIFPGTVERMNQSMHGVRNLVEYAATSHAEDFGEHRKPARRCRR